MRTFGDELKKLRKRRKTTQKQLAEKLGVSIAYIHQLETGKTAPPKIERCREIAAALEIDFNEIWEPACAERIRKTLKVDEVSTGECKPVVLNSSERKLIGILRAMDGDSRLRLLRMLRELVVNHPNDTMLILIADFLSSAENME